MNGIVTKSTGSWYTVFTDEGSIIDCRLKGKFRIKGIKKGFYTLCSPYNPC